jgi:hypothetical protein
MFAKNTFPQKWKDAEVCPLKKVQCPTQNKDFRPISLLWHCRKVAEQLAMERYKKQVIPKLCSNQFAYLPKLGTADALVTAIDDWTCELDKKDTMGIQLIFKDFSKAFDKMQPSILVEKLSGMQVNNSTIGLALDFLNGRTQCVVDKVAGVKSRQKNITVGVPQGTISGPLFRSPSSTRCSLHRLQLP